MSSSVVTPDHDRKLFELLPDQANSNNQVKIKASFNFDVVTEDSSSIPPTLCNLQVVGTMACDIDFEIHARTLYNNTDFLVVAGTVHFQTECLLMEDWYTYRGDAWTWPKGFFNTYIVRDPMMKENLPSVGNLKLPSIDSLILGAGIASYSLEDLCGVSTYEISGLVKTAPFTLVQGSVPDLYIYTDDPEDANKNDPNYEQAHAFTLGFSFDLFPAFKMFYSDQHPPLSFKIRDPCWGLSYSPPSI
jgi:hypothetical protein